MAKRHIRERGKSTGRIKEPRRFPVKKRISQQAIVTAADVGTKLAEKNISEVDIGELLDESLTDMPDSPITEDEEKIELGDKIGAQDDDDWEFDELPEPDPFDVEERKKIFPLQYIAGVLFENKQPSIHFISIPLFKVKDNLDRNALLRRYKILKEMAAFIAERQINFFLGKNKATLTILQQIDLIKDIQNKGYKLSKVHVSRMLDALFFRIEGIGDLPAEYFFKSPRDIQREAAKEFIPRCGIELNQLEKAKLFEAFLKDKGIDVNLSDNPNDHERYKNLKTIIKEAEKEYA